MENLNTVDGKIAIVKDSETGLLGAVVCPMEEFCSVVFEDGEWVVNTRKKDLRKVGETTFRKPFPYEPFGKFPEDAQQKYIESALESIKNFRKGEEG